MKTLKKIPKFKNEKEERAFWSDHDATEYIDFSESERLSLPMLKPSPEVSPYAWETMLQRLKVIANRKDIPYQSLSRISLRKNPPIIAPLATGPR